MFTSLVDLTMFLYVYPYTYTIGVSLNYYNFIFSMLTLVLLFIPLIAIAAIFSNMQYGIWARGEAQVTYVMSNHSPSTYKLHLRTTALWASVFALIITLIMFILYDCSSNYFQFTFFNLDVTYVNFSLGLDGSSLYFILLTTIIIPISLMSNWVSISNNLKPFLISILLLQILLLSVFLGLDGLLFYVYFESILPPLFILIGVFGSMNKVRASFYLFLYTLLGSLFMLLAILVMSSIGGFSDFDALYKTSFIYYSQLLLFSGIFFAFAVKTPTTFLNNWLLKAHVESPLSGSIILAGIVLKLSLYGIFRLILTILPKAYINSTVLVYVIGLITILYASLSTIRTVDVKELIAYSSVCHAAVYLMAAFSNSVSGIEGAILLGLAHGFVSSGLFICAGGVLYDRSTTRCITYYRGVTQLMPIFSIVFFVLCLGNCGVPLTLNFIGEFMSLYGILERHILFGALASSSIILSAAYTIYMFNRTAFSGSYSKYFVTNIPDVNKREFYMLLTLVIFTVIFGIYSAPILDGIHYSTTTLIYSSSSLLAIVPLTLKNTNTNGKRTYATYTSLSQKVANNVSIYNTKDINQNLYNKSDIFSLKGTKGIIHNNDKKMKLNNRQDGLKNKTKPMHVITESNYAGKIKHYPPANKEWSGSIYAYNSNNTKLSPYSDKLVSKLVRGYFNSYSRVLEGNIIKKRSRRYRLIRARLSTNRILVSRAEVKHTNDKALITVYIYNNDCRYYKNKLDNIVLNNNNIYKSIKQAELKLKPKLQYNRSNLYSLLYNKTFAVGGKSLESRFNMYEKKYIRDFFHKFLRKEIVSVYLKQLIRFNKLKFEKQYVSSLSDEIRKIYNKNVELNFVNLRYLYLNSSVFSSALIIKIRNRKNKLLTAIQNSLQMFDLPDINRQAVYNQIYNKNTVIQNLDLKSARTSLYNNINNHKTIDSYDIIDKSFYNFIPNHTPPYTENSVNELTKVIGSMRNKSVSGVRIEIAGRLTKRNTAARAISKLRYKGNIKDMDSSNKGLSTVMMRGNVKSNLQYTKLKSKWRIGSFGLKGWVSSS